MTEGMRKGLTSYGDADFSLFLRKAFIKAMGLSDDALARPIVGIANTFSDYNACHGNVPKLVEAIKRGVMLAGGAADGVPDDLDPRVVRASDQHVPAQPDGDGHRGDDPRPADGRGGADRRLRQDDSGADDGRAPRPTCRRSSCRSGRCSSATTRASSSAPAPTAGASGASYRGGRIDASEIERINERLAPTRRHLHGDGHGEHDGLHRRGDGPGAAALGLDPGDARRPPALGRGERRSSRRRWRVNGAPRPSRAHDAGRVPQRAWSCCRRSAARPTALVHLTAAAGRLGIEHRPRRVRPARARGAGAAST